jgi:hypothetical protein
MPAILVGPLAVECLTLLDDLLADSDRIYHRNVTIIQKVFHEQFLNTVGEYVGREQVASPLTPPALVEALVCGRLSQYRQELRQVQAGLIAEEREKRVGRDRAIHAYVASLLVQEIAA